MEIACLLGFFCGWLIVRNSDKKRHKKIMSEEIEKILEMKDYE